MALREILKIGNPLLRQVSREVTVFDDRLAALLDDMEETMKNRDGVGIAAPQVGILKRACLVCMGANEPVYELINPVIVKASGLQTGKEGCLSVPNMQGLVERPKKLVVDAQNRYGEMYRYKIDGFCAVAFAHEIDHLNGILYTDKMIQPK